MSLTGGYHLPKTNGNMPHHDLLILDSGSSQHQLQQLQQPQRPSPPFYLLSHYPLEPPPTGSTNLIDHWGLRRDFDKYVKQPISPSLSDFLTDIPLAETAQHKAASFAGDVHGGVGTLRSLFAGPIISKEILPLTEQQLSAFRLHREPTLPDMYQIYTSSPKETRSAPTTETLLPPPTTNPLPGPSPQVQRVINEQTSRISPDVKRKAPADTTPVIQQQTTTPVASMLNRTISTTSTPTLSTNANLASNSGHLNDDQDEMNLSKRKTKKTKKEKKV
ncbi:unnamed protein product [Adineta steineri]|uniref:Mediator of RNA polymerase II transcription subunit 19 n=1 Tax=Adineta steineri TaxID=433720 RepID=A0A813SPY5_9BILA|nr:unnamed protein product [Adineta steineri]CAF0795875.1 unnamed protein product [Adineta steineri]CAF0800073.1 unnamed protein product [Adineta steineri]CAF0854516.1 unnamed protein product [Adineta steineri]CAF0882970.1 unnamed protein product [Adineta steineri]